MRLPTLCGEFRTTQDPELRFTPAGKAVCNISLVASESKKNEQTGEWEDGDRTPFLSVTLWDKAAEAAVETITKGERVLVTGQLYAREYETRDGGKGQSIELKWATVAAIPGGKPRGERSNGGGGWSANQAGGGQQRQQQDPWSQQQQADPWATPSNNDAPPF